MQKHRKNRKVLNIWVLSVVVVVCTLLLMLNSGIKFLENAAGFIVLPFQRVGVNIVRGINTNVKSVFNSYDIQADNIRLKQELDSAKAQLQINSEIAKENERLTELLGYKDKYPEYKMMHAKVISFSSDNWSVIINLDKGSKHGLKAGMPVVAQGGLVGRILEVSDNWSKVVTIIDSRSILSAIVERSRDTGMIKGVVDTGNASGLCKMENMPFDPIIIPGDTIITAENGLFPKGLWIGRVSEVSKGRNGKDAFALVVPFVDFAHLENVIVMIKK